MSAAFVPATDGLAQPYRPAEEDPPALDFARILGAAAWYRLAPAIRERFAAKPMVGQPIRYRGIMQVVESSAAGWVMAQFCRLVGTPFAPYRGCDVPVAISLAAIPGTGAVVWQRIYRYPRRSVVVKSTKSTDRDGQLVERVAGGFVMRLALSEEGGALHFRSRGYFWQWGVLRLPLPAWLSPGAAHVVHEDLGAGRFRFAMTIRHALLGTLFHQDGVFMPEEFLP